MSELDPSKDDIFEAKSATMAEMRATLAEQDPEAKENLEKVLEIVGRYLHYDENSISFKKFYGNTVGEATKEGIAIDPIMLMHPVNRLAHVIFHEILHAGGDVENEGLVEACTEALLKSSGLYSKESGLEMTDVYEKSLQNFGEFISRVSDGPYDNKVLYNVFNLYYSGKYDEIYDLYDTKYVKHIEAENENELEDKQDEAWDFFREVFPELEIHSTDHTDGKFDIREDLLEAISEELEEETATGIA